MELRVLCALMGLEGASRTGVKTERTDTVRLRALAFHDGPRTAEEAEALTEAIHRERNAVSPDCASCLNPCGNTSDFPAEDMAAHFAASPQLEELLRTAGALAAALLEHGAGVMPPLLEEVPDCAAWQPTPGRIGRLKQDIERELEAYS